MLKGNVELNGVVIGEWTATNTRETHQEYNDYHCTIWFRKQDGYIYTAEWNIWGHHHGNGAFSLAARVLQEGNAKAKKKTNVDWDSLREHNV